MVLDTSLENIDIVLFHPYETIKVPLVEWIKYGPGERWGMRPMAAYDNRTGKKLPIRIIPLQYRNTWYVRLLIFFGIIPNPWK